MPVTPGLYLARGGIHTYVVGDTYEQKLLRKKNFRLYCLRDRHRGLCFCRKTGKVFLKSLPRKSPIGAVVLCQMPYILLRRNVDAVFLPREFSAQDKLRTRQA